MEQVDLDNAVAAMTSATNELRLAEQLHKDSVLQIEKNKSDILKRLSNDDIIGAVTAFPTQTAPSGWLECNGAALSRTAYANLFAIIGTTFGEGDGSTTFNLPDLRGEFIRGLDNGRGVDIGRILGSWQDSLTTIPHGVILRSSIFGVADGVVDHNSISHVVGAYDMNTAPFGNSSDIYYENRPQNVALLLCIKY